MNDLIYTQNGFFTRFFAETKDGEIAISEMIRVTGDTVIRNDHLKVVLKQLRKAGYKVCKAKSTKESKENILSELDSLLNELGVDNLQ